MQAEQDVQRFLRVLGATMVASGQAVGVDIRRRRFRSLMGLSGEASDIGGVEERVLDAPEAPLALRIYTSNPDAPGDAGLIFLHGGGLVAGSLQTHDVLCRRLAVASGCRVIAVGYRLAPEHKFPAAIADGLAAVMWVFEHAAELGLARDRIGIGGDSAGATLAAVICHALRQSPRMSLAFQLLLCPIMDYAADTASRRQYAADPLVNDAILREDLECYLPGGVPATHPYVSPLRAVDLTNVPPTFIHTAELDPLRDEGRLYADRLQAAGTEVRYTCHADMVHLFYALNRAIPYAATAIERIGQEVRSGLR